MNEFLLAALVTWLLIEVVSFLERGGRTWRR